MSTGQVMKLQTDINISETSYIYIFVCVCVCVCVCIKSLCSLQVHFVS